MLEIGKLYHFKLNSDLWFVSLYEKYDDGSYRKKLTEPCFCTITNKALDVERDVMMIQLLLPIGFFWITDKDAKLTLSR